MLLRNNRTNSGFRNPCYSGANNRKLNDYHKCREKEEQTFDINKKTVVVWGDSHAAHLIPGFRKYFGNEFNIMQRSRGSCAAILSSDNKSESACDIENNNILDEIISVRPYQVILAGSWLHRDYKNIALTIEMLHKNNINNIVILGSVPIYEDSLPKLLARYWIKNRKFPKHIKIFENEEGQNFVEKDISRLAEEWGVRFVSLSKILCSQEGCLAMIDNNQKKVFYFDHNHFTNIGSEFVIGNVKDDIKVDFHIGRK